MSGRLQRALLVVLGVPLTAAAASYLGQATLPRLLGKGDDSPSSSNTITPLNFAPYFDSWKCRIIGRYENRLRSFSHPLKVFQYFASERKNGVCQMTPSDLLQSLLYYRDVPETELPDPTYQRMKAQSAVKFFKFVDTDGDGLVSFSEYLVFLSLAMISEDNFDSAFSDIDADGNGALSRDEFLQFMQSEVRGQMDLPLFSQLGRRGSVSSQEVFSITRCSGLLGLFFGPEQKGTLSRQAFRGFLQRLRHELRKLEFYHYQVDDNDRVALRDVAYALVNFMPNSEMQLKHIKIRNMDPSISLQRVGLDMFVSVDRVAQASDKLDIAIRASHPDDASARLYPEQLKKLLCDTCGFEPPAALVSIFVELFQSSEHPGTVDYPELSNALRNRHYRGLNSPRHLDLQRGLRLFSVAR